jgi:hypothetical protein
VRSYTDRTLIAPRDVGHLSIKRHQYGIVLRRHEPSGHFVSRAAFVIIVFVIIHGDSLSLPPGHAVSLLVWYPYELILVLDGSVSNPNLAEYVLLKSGVDEGVGRTYGTSERREDQTDTLVVELMNHNQFSDMLHSDTMAASSRGTC